MKTFKMVSIVILITFIMKIMGFMRDILIAYRFGSGVETDAFFVSLTAVMLVSTILTSGINATLIPILSKVEKEEGLGGKITKTNNFLTIIFTISVLAVILAWLGSPYLIRLIAPGFNLEQFNLAINITRIGLPLITIATVDGIFKAYLQTELKFFETSVAELPNNLVVILFLVFFSNFFNIRGLMVSLVFGSLTTVIMLSIYAKRACFKYKLVVDIKDKYFKNMLKLLPPVLSTVAMGDIKTTIDKALASTLIDGSISALNYGNKLKTMILGIFIMSITSVIFPVLSKDASKETFDDFKKNLLKGINVVLIITVPAAIALIVLSEPIVKVAFERGEFSPEASTMTMGALIYYSIGLPAMGVRNFVTRAYHSLENTKIPMQNTMISISLNVILSIILIGPMEHRGLALGTSLSSIISGIILLLSLRKIIGNIQYDLIIRCFLKCLVASAVIGTLIYYSYLTFFVTYIYRNSIIGAVLLISIIIIAFLIYILLLLAMKVTEITWIKNIVLSKINK